MKAFAIVSDSKLVITTSQDVAIITQECMVQRERVATIQESNIIQNFEIVSCSLIHAHAKVITVHAVMMIGNDMVLQFEAGVFYNDDQISLSKAQCRFNGAVIDSNLTKSIIQPLIRDHVEEKFKPQIHQFYNEH